MTSIPKSNRNMYQVRAFYKDDVEEANAYVTQLFDNVYDAHSIYQYAMWELEENFVAVELIEYPKKDKAVTVDRETTRNITHGNNTAYRKVRKSLRLIMKNRQEEIEKEKKAKRILERNKRFDDLILAIKKRVKEGGGRSGIDYE
jgi:hypothetical protein